MALDKAARAWMPSVTEQEATDAKVSHSGPTEDTPMAEASRRLEAFTRANVPQPCPAKDTPMAEASRKQVMLRVDVGPAALEPCAGAQSLPTPILRGNQETPESLACAWNNTDDTRDVLLFFGHGAQTEHGYLSNFYVHAPFAFTIPPWCGVYAGRTTTDIAFAEKAIMLCKASLMGDKVMYARIEAAKSARETKALGRLVAPWNEKKWQKRVCDVARYVVEAKFTQVAGLGEKLMATGECLIAEAAPRDKVWGIGLGVKSTGAKRPCEWNGANVLGWALMAARDTLQTDTEDVVRPCKRSRQGGV